jgi:hypothetical protein
VTISGTGFGNSDGELHFVIGPYPAQDIVALPGNAVWLDTNIFSPVPSVYGFLAYSGVIYIKRLSDGAKSNLVPFQFEPDMEQREIRTPADFILASPNYTNAYFDIANDGIFHRNTNFFSGVTGVDQIFLTTKLKNGWTVAYQSIAYSQGYDVGGQLFALPSAIGTDSLSMSVYFSLNPAYFNGVGRITEYSIVIPIQGPSGIPDGVVCVSAPPPNTPCPSTN